MPEMVEDKEKQGQPSPAPSAAARTSSGAFPILARLWVVLGSLSWGVALAFLLSSLPALGGVVFGRGAAQFRGGALAAGAVLAGLLAFAGLKKLGSRLSWRKPGQGTGVRSTALAGAAFLAGFGAFSFYMLPSSTSRWWADLGTQKFLVLALALKPILFPALAIFFTATYGAFLFLNREKSTEFLVETEGELKKVSWPARREYVGSSVVVVVVIAVMSLFLHFVDEGLSWIAKQIGIGF